MDYTTLKDVSETIIDLIKAGTGSPLVFPEIIKGERNGIGYYLYHVQESSHYKNYPIEGRDTPPVKFSPMALNLYYQMSANWLDHNVENAFEEQILMNNAMKTLHDHPEILQTKAGKEVHIRITLQMLSPSESVQYWAASESPVKLSAYYEVSVVFLEPEKIRSYAGRVLSYGNYIFLGGAPRIVATSNVISYTNPIDLIVREVLIQPAEAPPGNIDPAANSIITITGSGFNGGIIDIILIRSFGNSDDKYLIQGGEPWNIGAAGEGKINFTVRESAISRKTGSAVAIVPGMYAVQIVNKKQQMLPGTVLKEFLQTSNQFPFSVMPAISSIEIAGLNLVRITGYLFEHPDIPASEVKVYIGDIVFSQEPIPEFPETALFTIVDAGTLELNITHISPGLKPVRVMVNGIESEPKWISI